MDVSTYRGIMARPARKPRRNKYGARKTVVDGHTFDSRKEAERYGELDLLQKQGVISGLVIHPLWDIVVEGTKVCRVEYDFRYEHPAHSGSVVIEDTKSPATRANRVYRLKKKLFEATHPYQVTEV